MSTPKLAIAMNYIDDDLVSGAVEYKRTKKKNSWLKWGAMAACLCLVVSIAFPFVFDRGQSSEPLPGGVTAEVIEVIDKNTWKVVVTGADDFYSNGEFVFVTLENISDDTEIISLCVGDEIAITYTSYDIVENRDGSTEIVVPEIEIISKIN